MSLVDATSGPASPQVGNSDLQRKRRLSNLEEPAGSSSKRPNLATRDDVTDLHTSEEKEHVRSGTSAAESNTPHLSSPTSCTLSNDVADQDYAPPIDSNSNTARQNNGRRYYEDADTETLGRTNTLSLKSIAQKIIERTKLQNIVKYWPTPASHEMESLCENCEKLELSYSSFVMESQETVDRGAGEKGQGQTRKPPNRSKKNMGTLREILRRSLRCPLCRLIVRSLAEQSNTLLAQIISDRDMDAEFDNWDAKCEVSWQVDGRDIFEDEDGERMQIPRTRRLSVQWPESDYLEAHLVLMYPNKGYWPPPRFLGRFLTSLQGSKHEQVKKWYKLCSEGKGNHGLSCSVDHKNEDFQDLRQESYFGVVDLEQMRLTSLPEDAEYAALSYTWGEREEGEERFRSTLRNVHKLKERDGISEIEDKLPKTIRDAIYLVRQLGIRYLWVDCLCILQGDDELWALNADRMDSVYGNASVTICAADGNSAKCGLKALEPLSSRHEHHAKQYIERIGPDLQLMVSYPSETFIHRSAWNTRAWTFQERVLSKRCIIFTEGRVYFQCRSTIMSEDIFAEEAEAGWSLELIEGPHLKYGDIKTRPIDVYKLSIMLYTSRDLTDEGDILAAFSGINREICLALGGEPIFGLPNTHFDFALLWKPDRAPIRRQKTSGKGMFKFPSWSWCGWKESRMQYLSGFTEGCELNLHEWIMDHTWITWYIRDGQGNLRLVWDPRITKTEATPALEHSESISGYRVSMPEKDIVDKDGYRMFDLYGRSIPPALRKHPRDKFFRTMPKYPYQVRMIAPGNRATRYSEQRLDDQRFLQFWTWSAYFYITPQEQDEDEESVEPAAPKSELVQYDIQDRDYSLVGSLTVGREWIKERCNLDEPQEFIAISDAKEFTNEEMREWNFYEPDSREKSQWYAYNVFLLEKDEEIGEVVRRAALGKIFKKAFDTACLVEGRNQPKEWKEIILG